MTEPKKLLKLHLSCDDMKGQKTAEGNFLSPVRLPFRHTGNR